MKSSRHTKILELIEKYNIETQDELIGHLKDAGFHVTQATVSRDIKDLRLAKTLGPGGRYRYSIEAAAAKAERSDKFISLFTESVISIDYAGNIAVFKCHTGTANAACAAFDTIKMNGVVGTISGDDTFLAIVRTPEDVAKLCEDMRFILG